MSDAEPLIRVENLYKIFGPDPRGALRLADEGVSKADIFARTGSTIGVRDASFEVHKGEVFVVMGLSGSGKSTLLRLVNRLIEPTRGIVKINGRDVVTMNRKELIHLRRSEMTMVFQSFALLPHLTVLGNAAFGLEIAGVERPEREHRAMAALEQVGLEANANSYPEELSGGMQQRVGLARALAGDPAVLLMDEAFSALDPLIRTEMQDQLLDLQREHPRTVLFISHDLDEAMRIGDRILVMEGGRVLQTGTAEEILENPVDERVRSFFGGVDIANVYRAGDIAVRDGITVIRRRMGGLRSALQRLHVRHHEHGYVIDPKGRLLGVVSVQSLLRTLDLGASDLSAAFLPVEAVTENTSFDDLVDRLTRAPCPVPVIDDHGRLVGVVSKTALLETMHRPGGEQ